MATGLGAEDRPDVCFPFIRPVIIVPFIVATFLGIDIKFALNKEDRMENIISLDSNRY